MNENMLKKWKALYDKWRNKKPAGYVDAKSDSGAAKPQDRKGVYIVPSELDYAPGQYDIPHAMQKANSEIPHWNYQADPDDRKKYDDYEKSQRDAELKSQGVEPVDRELTDFEGARTMTKWEDEEDRRRKAKFEKGRQDFWDIAAQQPTIDMKTLEPPRRKLTESKNIKITVKGNKK